MKCYVKNCIVLCQITKIDEQFPWLATVCFYFTDTCIEFNKLVILTVLVLYVLGIGGVKTLLVRCKENCEHLYCRIEKMTSLYS